MKTYQKLIVSLFLSSALAGCSMFGGGEETAGEGMNGGASTNGCPE